jgi:hypothetical protein
VQRIMQAVPQPARPLQTHVSVGGDDAARS